MLRVFTLLAPASSLGSYVIHQHSARKPSADQRTDKVSEIKKATHATSFFVSG